MGWKIGGYIMPSKLVLDLIEDKATIEQTLQKLKIISRKLNIDVFKEWIDYELKGYPKDAILPEYRKTDNFNIQYSGVASNVYGAFSNTGIPKDIKKIIYDNGFRDSINSIKERSGINKVSYQDITYLRDKFGFNKDLIVTELKVVYSNVIFSEMLITIKNKLLDILLELEDMSDDLDSLMLNKSKVSKEKKENIIKVITYDTGKVETI